MFVVGLLMALLGAFVLLYAAAGVATVSVFVVALGFGFFALGAMLIGFAQVRAAVDRLGKSLASAVRPASPATAEAAPATSRVIPADLEVLPTPNPHRRREATFEELKRS